MDAESRAIEKARYSALVFQVPLSDEHARTLVQHLDLTAGTTVVELGCGWAELLLRAVEQTNNKAKATGVDTNAALLVRGAQAARARGVHVDFVKLLADDWRRVVDRAICLGAADGLGGPRAMLARLAQLVPRGKVLVGDRCWECAPGAVAQAIFVDVPMLDEFVGLCHETGWHVLHMSTASQFEWDDFESRSRAGLRQWLVANPSSPRAHEISQLQHRREWQYLAGYRGVLGFVYVVLGR